MLQVASGVTYGLVGMVDTGCMSMLPSVVGAHCMSTCRMPPADVHVTCAAEGCLLMQYTMWPVWQASALLQALMKLQH